MSQEVAGVIMTNRGVMNTGLSQGHMEKPTPRLLTTHIGILILIIMQA
jgi:hypothetical protein